MFFKTTTFETELSDFHKLAFTILKEYFPKQKAKAVLHRR